MLRALRCAILTQLLLLPGSDRGHSRGLHFVGFEQDVQRKFAAFAASSFFGLWSARTIRHILLTHALLFKHHELTIGLIMRAFLFLLSCLPSNLLPLIPLSPPFIFPQPFRPPASRSGGARCRGFGARSTTPRSAPTRSGTFCYATALRTCSTARTNTNMRGTATSGNVYLLDPARAFEPTVLPGQSS